MRQLGTMFSSSLFQIFTHPRHDLFGTAKADCRSIDPPKPPPRSAGTLGSPSWQSQTGRVWVYTTQTIHRTDISTSVRPPLPSKYAPIRRVDPKTATKCTTKAARFWRAHESQTRLMGLPSDGLPRNGQGWLKRSQCYVNMPVPWSVWELHLLNKGCITISPAGGFPLQNHCPIQRLQGP